MTKNRCPFLFHIFNLEVPANNQAKKESNFPLEFWQDILEWSGEELPNWILRKWTGHVLLNLELYSQVLPWLIPCTNGSLVHYIFTIKAAIYVNALPTSWSVVWPPYLAGYYISMCLTIFPILPFNINLIKPVNVYFCALSLATQAWNILWYPLVCKRHWE